MRRRELLKGLVITSAPLAFRSRKNPGFPGCAGGYTRISRTPDLDELADNWISGSILENRPSVSNFDGSLQTSRNVLGIENFTVPPLAQGSELAGLTLDGEDVPAQDFRWYPYQLLRRTRVQNLQIVTTVRMPFEESGILFSFCHQPGREASTARLAVNLQAAIRHYPLKWTWDTPRPRREDLSDFSTSTIGSGSGWTSSTRTVEAVPKSS